MNDLCALLEKHQKTLALAESCTGGLIAAAVTAVPGSSAVFDRGFVTYSNRSKIEMLGVRPETLVQYGAVSAHTAEEMAIGALHNSQADIALSVTGIAGPAGGTPEKPVGTVYIGLATKDGVQSFKNKFTGDREAVRQASLQAAIGILLKHVVV
jgi:nicotinamide-nucleotide amidase